MLLHYGGFNLQDIFYSIPDAEVTAAEESPHIKTIQILETYFKSKINTTYEKHIFRNLTQDGEETMTQYNYTIAETSKELQL